jgi:hypothetical protein
MSAVRFGFTNFVDSIYALCAKLERVVVGPGGITFGGLTGLTTNQTPLRDYEEYSYSTVISGYTVPQTAEIKLTRIGKVNMMYIEAPVNAVQKNLGSLLQFATPIPERFAPSTDLVFSVPVVDDNSGTHGILLIETDGSVSIGIDGSTDSNGPKVFTNGADKDAGYQYPLTVCWLTT